MLSFPSSINSFSLSPDGALIAYSMGGEGNLDLYISTLDGGDLRCYRHPGMEDVFAVWSPDSSRFVFNSSVPHQGPVQLYLMGPEDLSLCAATGYERLSPSKVRVPQLNLTVEVSGKLTPTRLDISMDISVPVDFLTAIPLNTDKPIVNDPEISAMSLPLILERKSGGGGSGVENNIFMAGGTQSYRVKTPLTPGDKVQFSLLVSFGEQVPFRGAIPLTVDLVVEAD